MQVSSTKALNNQTLPTQEKSKNLTVSKSSPEVTALERASDAKSASERSALISSSKHKSWSNLSDAQAKLYRLQSMGETFHHSQEALLDLAREMTTKLPESSRLLYQISILKQKLSGQTQVDQNFLPSTATGKASFKLERIDLLSNKNQDESIQIRLPDNSQVDLKIDKNQSKEATLRSLKESFQPLGLRVSQDSDGKLLFNGPESMMDSVWLFQGQGLRIPAGNSVPVNLSKLPDTLTNLSSLIEKGDMQGAQDNLRTVLQDLSKKSRIVRTEIDNVVSSQSEIDEGMVFDSLKSSEILKELFSENNDFTKIKALMTQANVSRDNVVDTLLIE